MKLKKIVYIINHLSFFYSHFLPLAQKCLEQGHEIYVLCGKGGSKNMEKQAENYIKKKNINFYKFDFEPGVGSFFNELKNLILIHLKLRKINPQIIHGISLKGILISCLHSIITKPKKLICNVTGMGYFFTYKLNFYEKIIKKIILKIMKSGLLLKNSILIVENRDDYTFFKEVIKIPSKKIFKIKGTGVNLKKFKYSEKLKKNIVLFPARVLLEKGILDFLEASDFLSKKYKKWQFLIAGTLDYKKQSNKNPLVNFDKYKSNKNIKFLGFRNDMHKIFERTKIVCLPSYREGFPKSLIEATSSGCSIVTTNVPGCKEVVNKNINGYLCEPKNINCIRLKIEKLILNKSLRKMFSKNSRNIAIQNFSIDKFINHNLNLYNLK